MADKKSSEPHKSPQDEALEEKVDEMMSVEKNRDTDVSKLAEDFNKKIMSSEPVSGDIEVKPSAPPELPQQLKVEDQPSIEEKPEEPEPETPAGAVSDEAEPDDEFDDQKT